MIVEGGQTWRGNWGRLAICVIGCKATAQGLIHREMVEEDIRRGGVGNRDNWSMGSSGLLPAVQSVRDFFSGSSKG